MFFFVNNTTTDKIVFFVSEDGKDWREHNFDSENEGDLEKSFEKVLQIEKIKLGDVEGMAVRVGVGRFTATRLACTFANVLAYSLQIPVIAVEGDDLGEIVKKLKNTQIGQYISAVYSAEPRIGGINDK
ncbi:MAG: hypothetical protein WC725_02190 [Patescibacteria group bacterium]|jgi:tRNA A37 threonylcarbamoyladenosine modification protein TsaB